MPQLLKDFLRFGYCAVKQMFLELTGHKVRCNVCGFPAKQMRSDPWHSFTNCQRCKSNVRQRLLWAALTFLPEVSAVKIIVNKKLIHFAPEQSLSGRIKKMASEYHTADFLSEGYSYKSIDFNIDISDMPSIASNSYDCLIACDVLEHVPNDGEAIKEIYRVLKPGGWCILTVPQKDDLKTTCEDLSNLSGTERELKFGQYDHMRIYGSDFPGRLQANGFDVLILDERNFDAEKVRYHVLAPPIKSTQPFATNFRKVFFGQKRASRVNQ